MQRPLCNKMKHKGVHFLVIRVSSWCQGMSGKLRKSRIVRENIMFDFPMIDGRFLLSKHILSWLTALVAVSSAALNSLQLHGLLCSLIIFIFTFSFVINYLKKCLRAPSLLSTLWQFFTARSSRPPASSVSISTSL